MDTLHNISNRAYNQGDWMTAYTQDKHELASCPLHEGSRVCGPHGG